MIYVDLRVKYKNKLITKIFLRVKYQKYNDEENNFKDRMLK